MIGLRKKKPDQVSAVPQYVHRYADGDEEDASYFSLGQDVDEQVQGQENEESGQQCAEFGDYNNDYDEASIDPELLCPDCNTQTHEYVRRGKVLKKWKRMPVEDADIVDQKTGECVNCRVNKLKDDLLGDLPELPESFLLDKNLLQSNDEVATDNASALEKSTLKEEVPEGEVTSFEDSSEDSFEGGGIVEDPFPDETEPDDEMPCDILEEYVEEKDRVSTKNRMAEMGRTFRTIILGRNYKDCVDEESTKEHAEDTDKLNVDPANEGGSIEKEEEIQETNSMIDDTPVAEADINEERDPQDFYDEAAAVVAATTSNENKPEKKKMAKFFRRSTNKKVCDPTKGVPEDPPHSSDREIDFPDVLEEANPFLPQRASVPNNKETFGEKIPIQGEQPTLPNSDLPAFASFPNDIVDTDVFGSQLPPPVLEIAADPDVEEDPTNPNTTDVEHLIKGIQETVEDPRLARKFLISLRTMSIHHPNRLGIAEAGGILSIVLCMDRFKRESSVAKQGCAALQNLVCADMNESLCVEEGGHEAVVRAMMNHIRSPGTQEHGAATLRNLTAGSLRNRTAVAEAGGIEALVRAMKFHSRNVAVQEKGCAALCNLCIKHSGNRKAIGELGGIHFVVQALRRYGYKSRGIAEKGIRCLLNLSNSSSNIEKMKWECGFEGLILGVGNKHGGRPKEWSLKVFLKL